LRNEVDDANMLHILTSKLAKPAGYKFMQDVLPTYL